jgi:hypothetical protein
MLSVGKRRVKQRTSCNAAWKPPDCSSCSAHRGSDLITSAFDQVGAAEAAAAAEADTGCTLVGIYCTHTQMRILADKRHQRLLRTQP